MYTTEMTIKVTIEHHGTPPVSMIKSVFCFPAVLNVEIVRIESDYKVHSNPLLARVEQLQYDGDNWKIAT